MEYDIRVTFTVTMDATVEADSSEHAETIAVEYLSNECNFTVEKFKDFQCKELQFDCIEIEDVNESE